MPIIRNFFGGTIIGFVIFITSYIPVGQGVCVRKVCGWGSSLGVKTSLPSWKKEERRKRRGNRDFHLGQMWSYRSYSDRACLAEIR